MTKIFSGPIIAVGNANPEDNIIVTNAMSWAADKIQEAIDGAKNDGDFIVRLGTLVAEVSVLMIQLPDETRKEFTKVVEKVIEARTGGGVGMNFAEEKN
jgi:hypothetical protein